MATTSVGTLCRDVCAPALELPKRSLEVLFGGSEYAFVTVTMMGDGAGLVAVRVVLMVETAVTVTSSGTGELVEGPQRSEMMTVTNEVTGSAVRKKLVWTAVTVEGLPETVASGRLLVRDTSVRTLVTVAGFPEMVTSGKPVTETSTSVTVAGLPEMVASGSLLV